MKIPDRIFGISTEEALKKYLEESGKPMKKQVKSPEKKRVITPRDIKAQEDYIILPGKTHGSYSYPDLLVSTETTHKNLNWYKAHEALKKERAFMLTIPQFVDFLNLLRSGEAYDGNGKKVQGKVLSSIYDEITEIREPWRSEWLDAKFEKHKKGIFRSGTFAVKYHKLDSSSNWVEVTDHLEDSTLLKDKDPGISLEDWLKDPTYEGLPKKSTSAGDLYYYAPVDGTVARFGADSGRAGLYCFRDPLDSNPVLGVRQARGK